MRPTKRILLFGLLAVAYCDRDVAATPIRFTIIGDYGTRTAAADDVADLVNSWQPDFIVSVGDNNYGDNSLAHDDWDELIGARYGSYIQARSDNKYPNQTSETPRFYPTVGNHDAHWVGPNQSSRAGYLDYFHDDPALDDGRLPAGTHHSTRSHYSFSAGPAEFFVFDGHAAVLDQELAWQEYLWLEAAAISSQAQWRFVVNHYPPYSSGYEGNLPAVQWPFAEWGIDAVFSGHDHIYDRLAFEGTAYFVVGTSGQGLYDLRPTPHPLSIARSDTNYGALFVSVDGDSATFEFVSVEEVVVDALRLTKALPEPSPTAWLLPLVAYGGRSIYRRRLRFTASQPDQDNGCRRQ